MIPDSYLDAMKVEDSAALWGKVLTAAPNTTSTFVAENGGRVVGFASGMLKPEAKLGFDCELTGIYLAREANAPASDAASSPRSRQRSVARRKMR
jgi:hypothetical protein